MPFWADKSAGDAGTTPPAGEYPPASWPTIGQLTYTKEAITVLLLVLALPWLIAKLLSDPGAVLSGLGRRAASKSV